MTNIPPILEKRPARKVYFLTLHCTFTRLLLEIVLTAILGIMVFGLPMLFVSQHPNYEGGVFLPMVSEAMETPHPISIVLLVLVSFAAGVFGRGPVWLVGPATLFAFPVWAVIDTAAGSGGHDLIPIELLAYAVSSLFFIPPTAFGRAVRFLIEL